MASVEKRPLKVFLCHASGDKPPVRDLYKRLSAEGVDPWLDKENLLPGQDWRLEIPKAVQEADVVVVCLSNKSVTKEGYVQKEIKFALDIAEEKPEGTIFLIPARLEECVVPERLGRWHWVDLYEENGFIQLLRSLKLRADAVGATVEPTTYEDSDKEVEYRLDQLYTEGLAAFYTEDWDRACHRFQSILSERPNHKHATEKMAEAERQRDLSRLYAQALEAVQSENWQVAIKTLEGLSRKSADYKDAAQLLRNARKQEKLKELYAEAKTLYVAQKWQAVVKVFEQISAIDTTYPDPEGLLPSAQKEVMELKRLADLNDLYSHAVREMDAGQWYEARRLLEQVHKSQTGFLETERLLRKVEDEIVKVEEHNQRNNQVNVLYEQAHSLLRSKKWRKALDKMVEIQVLDDQFLDKDKISEKAKTELVREEREAQRQNELAAMYAEAVRLLKDEKYQEALDKWREVKVIDPKYPDRQWVQRTARKKLLETAKSVQIKPRFVISRSLWMGIVGLIAVGAVIVGVIFSGKGGQNVLPTSISAPIKTITANPTKTKTPNKTSTPRPATIVPIASGYSDPTMYDDFDNTAYDGSYNKSLWVTGGGTNSKDFMISQKDGKLSIIVRDMADAGLAGGYLTVSQPTFFEVRLFLDPNTIEKDSNLYVELKNDKDGYSLCNIYRTGDYAQGIGCSSEYYGKFVGAKVGLDGILPGWHIFRFEIEPENMVINYLIDGVHIGSYDPKESIPDHLDELKRANFWLRIALVNNSLSKAPVGYIDYVRMGAIKDDPTILFYDDFNVSAFDRSFDADKWELSEPINQVNGRIYQDEGSLVFTQTERGYTSLQTKNNFKFIDNKPVYIEANLKFINETVDDFLTLRIDIDDSMITCSLHGMLGGWVIGCDVLHGQKAFSRQVGMSQWHIIRVEISPQATMIRFIVDGELIDTYEVGQDSSNSTVRLLVQSYLAQENFQQLNPLFGYIDNVRIGIVEK